MRAIEETNRRMLRARDTMDREYAQPLDIERLAKIAIVSEAHFIRTFKATFGETDISLDVGFASLGTFSRTFHEIVGESPSAYRKHADVKAVPNCFTMRWMRPSSFGEDREPAVD